MAGKDQRSLRNIVLTSKYHRLYMGQLVLIYLAFIPLIYGLILSNIMVMARSVPDFPLREAVAVLTLVCFCLGVAILALGVLTAHRIAGPYIKLVDVCRAIAKGDRELKLKFRAGDRLEELEEAFNQMMVAVLAEKPEPSAAPEPGEEAVAPE